MLIKFENLKLPIPKLSPEEAQILERMRRRADEKFHAGKFEECAATMRMLALFLPNDPRLLAHLGVALVCAGKPEEGLRYLERLTRLTPKDPSAWMRFGGALLCRGKCLEALTAFNEALSLDALDVGAMTMIGKTMLTLNQPPTKAEKYLRQAISIKPSHAEAWVHLGIALGRQQKSKDAEQVFKRALALHPPPGMLLLIHEELRRLNCAGCLALNDTQIALGAFTPPAIKTGA
jgi:Flp pilus assembly protein TadD